MIKIDFEYDTQFGIFRDALHLPDNHGLIGRQIEDLKKERLNNWLKHFEPAPETPTE